MAGEDRPKEDFSFDEVIDPKQSGDQGSEADAGAETVEPVEPEVGGGQPAVDSDSKSSDEAAEVVVERTRPARRRMSLVRRIGLIIGFATGAVAIGLVIFVGIIRYIENESIPEVPVQPAAVEGLPGGPELPVSGQELRLEEVMEAVREVGDAVRALDEKIDSVKKEFNDAVLYLDERNDVNEHNDNRFLEVINSLSVQVNSLAAQIDGLAVSGGEINHDEAVVEPDFRLVGVDKWGGHWNAVISMDGKKTTLVPGDSRGGWRLIEVDPAARAAVFEHLQGRRLVLEIW